MTTPQAQEALKIIVKSIGKPKWNSAWFKLIKLSLLSIFHELYFYNRPKLKKKIFIKQYDSIIVFFVLFVCFKQEIAPAVRPQF